MKTYSALVAAILLLASALFAQEKAIKTAVIDDFSNQTLNSLGGNSGAWSADPHNPDLYTKTEIVSQKDFPEQAKNALKLSYSVDTDKEAMTGYWTVLNNFDASDYDELVFYVKGDKKEGFTTTFKLEIKKPKPGSEIGEKLAGTKTFRKVTGEWQLVRIPLNSFTGLFDKSDPSLYKDPSKALEGLAELVIVLNKRTVTAKKGALYFNNFRFIKTGEDYPTVFDAPDKTPKDKACLIFENPANKRKLLAPGKNKKGAYEELPVPVETVAKAEESLKQHKDSMVVVTDRNTEYCMHLNDNSMLCFLDRENYMRFLINRLEGFPLKTVVKKSFPADDREFLKEIARDTWGYFDEIVDSEYGLPLDTLVLDKNSPMGPETSIADYTNITNIGVYLCCIVSAYDLGFITRDEAVAKATRTLQTVGKMPAHSSGFLYNYYDTTWLCRTDYLVSYVDSGWLAAGVYVVKNAFPAEMEKLCKELLSRWDFGFFYDNSEGHMYHGFIENIGDYSDYHYGIFYTEPRLTSFMAIGRGDVPAEHWFRMTRTFPSDYNWTTQKPKGRKEKKFKDISYFGGWYEYNGLKYVPSWGGSMFEALMPALLIDEKKYAPKGLGLNNEMHVKIAIDYTLNTLKYPVWGMSPSSIPEGGYGEFGVKVLGTKGYEAGAVTPHATFLALDFAPEEAVANLRRMLKGWDIYGEYGFYDALDVKTKKVAYKYLALDQGMILMAINNHLNNGSLRNYMQKDPVFKKADALLSAESFFE